MISAISAGLSLLVAPLGEWLKGKQEITRVKSEAKAKRAEKLLDGWVPEYIILIMSFPFIAVFIPYLAPYTTEGFRVLHTLPEWYINTFITLIFMVFGVSKMERWVKR